MHILLENATLLKEGNHHLIYLTQQEGQPASVLKLLKPESHATDQLFQLKNEWQISEKLGEEATAIRPVIRKFRIGHQQALLYPYIQGNSLDEFIEKKEVSVTIALIIAINLCEALEQLHAQQVIHRDITAHNFLINPDEYTVTLIDLGLATEVSVKTPFLGNPNQLQGSLAYISPEQTGRVDRIIDRRSDLYSLGVVLFKLFTGQLPFESKSALEIVHQHLAVIPQKAHKIRPDVPEVVSGVIAKLLSKDPDQRYQSIGGLKHDLELCFAAFRNKGHVEGFALGQEDYTEDLSIPTAVYGREEELEVLKQALRAIKQGQAQVCWIEGLSGVGKSSLVKELYPYLGAYNALMAQGKFSSVSNEPYFALVSAFNHLIDLLLTEPEEQLVQWKIRIKQALGLEGAALVKLIPRLGNLLGDLPEAAELIGAEAQARLTYLFNQFVQALAQPGHPLILFLDDLQWADGASLAAITALLNNPELSHFLLIGAYRSDEIDELHPVRQIQQAALTNPNPLATTAFTLTNLRPHDVSLYLADVLHLPVPTVASLAQVVVDKTGGNPLFVQQYLQMLQDSGTLFFGKPSYLNPDDSRPRWQWDIFKIKRLQLSSNLAEILAQRVERLPQPTRKLLQIGAVIGSTFTDKQLTLLSHKSYEQIAHDLIPALQEDLLLVIQHITDNGQEDRQEAQQAKPLRSYQFSHDKVHQAVLASLDAPNQVDYSFALSQHIMQQPGFDNTPTLVFEAVHHLNRALDKVKDGEQQTKAIELNLKANNLAIKALAYQQAYKYAQAALTLAGNYPGIDPALKHSIYLSLTETAYLSGNYKDVPTYSEEVIEQSGSTLSKAKAYDLKVKSLIGLNHTKEAIAYARIALKLFGIELPAQASKSQILLDLIKTALKLKGKRVEQLAALPTMQDEQTLAAMQIMATIGPIISRNEPTVFPLLVGQLLRLSQQLGNAVESIPAYSGYGILQSVAFKNYNKAYQFGQVALELIDKLQARQILPKTNVVIYSFLHFLKEPVRSGSKALLQNYQTGLEVGDHEFAAYSLFVKSIHSFLAGQALTEFSEQASVYNRKLKELNQNLPLYELSIFQQAAYNLQNNLEDWLLFNGPYFYEDEFTLATDYTTNRATSFYLQLCKLIIAIHFNKIDEAVKILPKLEENQEGVQGTMIHIYYQFYGALACLRAYTTASKAQQKLYKQKVKASLSFLGKLAKHAPSNFLNKVYLIRAELLRIENKPEKAFGAYSRAFSYAQAHDFLPEEALAYEYAGRYFSGHPSHLPGSLLLQKAHDLYLQWGAGCYAEELRKEFIFLYNKVGTTINPTNLKVTTNTNYYHYSELEFGSILKASTAIAKEIQLKRLLSTLLPILIENAGAERGALLIQEKLNQWVVAAQSQVGKQEVDLSLSQSLSDNKELPDTIINYSIRTHQELLLVNAQQDQRFNNDPVVKSRQIHSIFCLPILSKGNLIALLYLENNLANASFTSSQLETLRMLSGQMAVSLENAMLYENLEQKVEERTIQLNNKQEELERKNRALLELNAEKDELVNIVAHDLRSPLNQIRGMVNLIKLDVGKLSEDQKQYLSLISQSGERLGQMITNILNSSSNEGAKLSLTTEAINISDLAQELIIHYRTGAAEKNIELTFSPNPEPATALIDRGYCFQALENLVSNAIKFSPPETQVSITVDEVDQYIRVRVSDQGPGLTLRDQKRLFSRFQTLSAKPTAGEASSGLGLSISKRYIEAMQGKIGVESHPGQGATFYVLLPKAR